MVYCGKPSKGCSNCRERKIRCDQKEPGCGQCGKRQQKCPGYRNLVDLMFRDESSHVIKKAKARARKKGMLGPERSPTPCGSEGRPSVTPEPRRKQLTLVVPPTPSPNSPANSNRDDDDDDDDDGSILLSPGSGRWPGPPPVPQCYNLAPGRQEEGIAYFFSKFVNRDETACHQKFDFLRDVWRPSSPAPGKQVDVVLASMTAVGLMGLARARQTGGFIDAARKSYGTALQLTKAAIEDPVEAVKDTTMLSTLILGVFEMMTETTPRSLTMKAFQNHVSGAIALARMRGPSQFRTQAGRRMFSMLCERAIMSCAQRNEPMPSELVELWHEMSKTLEDGNPNKRLMPLIWQVLQLRSEINKSTQIPEATSETGISRLEDPKTILDRMLALEEEFEALTTQLPKSWQYRAFRVTQDHPAVYRGICHLYSSLHHANFWNNILTMRILLLESIKFEISRDFRSFTPSLDTSYYLDEFDKARRKLKRLVHAITASVPQQLGLMNTADGSIDSQDSESPPIATVEIRYPSPPTSPSSRSTDSDSPSEPRNSQHHHPSPWQQQQQQQPPPPSGLTITDMTRARDAEDEADRYMLLASATSTVVWPLFVVGMSTACSDDMHAYVIDRLRTLYLETNQRQAEAVAGLLEEHGRGDDHPMAGCGGGGGGGRGSVGVGVVEEDGGVGGGGGGFGEGVGVGEEERWLDMGLEGGDASLRLGMDQPGMPPECMPEQVMLSPPSVVGNEGFDGGLGLQGRFPLKPEFDSGLVWV
ncbi:hypothetical protein VTK26DRAFT_5740 [Humicola hyalothermophila]